MHPTTVSIHRVHADNANLLDRVDADVFDHPVRPELLRAFLANPASLLVVAVEGDLVVGMATGIAYVHPDKPLQLFVNEVGVAGPWHRQGIGSALIRTLLQWGKELGCGEAWVATETGNAPARALYGSLGGREDEDLAVVYLYALEDGADA